MSALTFLAFRVKGLLDDRGTGAQITLFSTSTHARNQVACLFGRLVLRVISLVS